MHPPARMQTEIGTIAGTALPVLCMIDSCHGSPTFLTASATNKLRVPERVVPEMIDDVFGIIESGGAETAVGIGLDKRNLAAVPIWSAKGVQVFEGTVDVKVDDRTKTFFHPFLDPRIKLITGE